MKKGMAIDITSPGTGNIFGVATVILGIVSNSLNHLPIAEFGQAMTFIVGCYTVYINWPRFKDRIKETFS